jgi:TRAP-type C4-dicarboxylate transport system permease small subunit
MALCRNLSQRTRGRVLPAEEHKMNAMNVQKIAAVLLIVAGALALVYGGFSYTKQTHQADVGPLHLSIDERRHVNVPVWAGIGAIVLGGVLLVVRTKS